MSEEKKSPYGPALFTGWCEKINPLKTSVGVFREKNAFTNPHHLENVELVPAGTVEKWRGLASTWGLMACQANLLAPETYRRLMAAAPESGKNKI